MRSQKLRYPHNKSFALTIFDDTDVATLGNIKPVYDHLLSLGILTTKTVWPLPSNHRPSDYSGSHTLQDKPYADYIKELSNNGIEIAFHGASMESSTRDKTLEAIKIFYETLGFYPRSYSCHSNNAENLYWGSDRFAFKSTKLLYRLLHRAPQARSFGHEPESPYYWGDICLKYIDYVRTFTFHQINLLKISDKLPYATRRLPFLKACFFTSEANNVEEFNSLLTSKHLTKLEKQRGVCIITTHFGKGFVKNGRLNPKTRDVLIDIASRNGWFVPVSTLLDYLKGLPAHTITDSDLLKLELTWFVHSIKRRTKKRTYEKSELFYLQH